MMSRLPLRSRILIALLVPLLVIAGLTAYLGYDSVQETRKIRDKMEIVARAGSEASATLAQARVNLLKVSISLRDTLLAQSNAEREAIEKRRGESVAALLKNVEDYKALASPGHENDLNELKSRINTIAGLVNDFAGVVEAGKRGDRDLLDSAQAMGNQSIQTILVPARSAILESIDRLAELETSRREQILAEGQTISVDARRNFMLIAGIMVAIIFVAAIGVFLQVSRLSSSLESVTKHLSSGSTQLESSKGVVVQYSNQLAEASHKQAAAVQETVAAMAEMSSMIGQTTKGARAADTIIREVAVRADEGRVTMHRLTSTMGSIQAANGDLQAMADIIAQISAKTAVINDIVFKTQLLSFNASIEAARAGQHGRGFAVVAEEVGNLAQMSGTAAKEIQAMLGESNKNVALALGSIKDRVQEGNQVSLEASTTFNDIAAQIARVAEQLRNITEATSEQESGIRQTNAAMDQMDSATRHNSELARQVSGAARMLEGQSLQLQKVALANRLIVEGTAAVQREQESTTSGDPIDQILSQVPRARRDTVVTPAAEPGTASPMPQPVPMQGTAKAARETVNADHPGFDEVA